MITIAINKFSYVIALDMYIYFDRGRPDEIHSLYNHHRSYENGFKISTETFAWLFPREVIINWVLTLKPTEHEFSDFTYQWSFRRSYPCVFLVNIDLCVRVYRLSSRFSSWVHLSCQESMFAGLSLSEYTYCLLSSLKEVVFPSTKSQQFAK